MPPPSTRYAFVDQTYVLEEKASVSLFDLGLTRGYALTTSLRSYGGEPFLWQKYLKKLYLDAEKLQIVPPYSFTEIYTILKTLLQKNQLEEAAFKILLTGGPSYTLQVKQPILSISCTPYVPLDPQLYEKGVNIKTLIFERPYPEMKTTFYLPALQQKNLDPLFFEVLYLSTNQHILEAATSNFFAVKNQTLITPSSKIYQGITRNLVLSLTKEVYRWEERDISYEELSDFEEVFLTATYKEILPISQIDGFPFPTKTVSSHLQTLFQKYVQKKDWIYKPQIEQTIPT